jgi:hypothetical protein
MISGIRLGVSAEGRWPGLPGFGMAIAVPLHAAPQAATGPLGNKRKTAATY